MLGEGAAALLVEDEDVARARGARPFARVASVVSRGAPVSPQRRRADPATLAAVMNAALAEAGVTPRDVGLVHLSRNGVPATDAAEEAALAAVFGLAQPPAVAIKEALGENPAIGAVQLALAADALRTTPSLGAVLVNAFGAGGNFLAAVLTAP